MILTTALVAALVMIGGVALAQTRDGTGSAAIVPADSSRQDPVVQGSGVDEDPRGVPYAAGELLVIYEEKVSARSAGTVGQEVGAEVGVQLPEIDAASLSFPEVEEIRDQGLREEALVEEKQDLEANPSVESVSYNYLLQAQSRDPLYGRLWHLPRIKAPQAWPATRGAGVRIAIVDNGIENAHPDLTGGVVFERDYVEGDSVAQPSNTGEPHSSSHGTHVAGIAGARADNNVGVAGVAPRASLMDYKVVGPNGATVANVSRAIMDAANAGAGVINMSLGGPSDVPALRNAVNYAWSRGAVLTGSAGNGFEQGNPPNYPSGYPNVIAVGGVTRGNARSNFSRAGPDVDVVAPGGSTAAGAPTENNILSTLPYYFWPFTGCDNNPDCSGYEAGTSQAAPQVAGIAAMLKSRGMNNVQIRQRILSTATDLGTRGRDNSYGYGLVNAQAAVNPPRDATAPTGRVSINGGDATTRRLAVRLALGARDNAGGTGVAQMCISNTAACGSWRAYATASSWRLRVGGTGARTVYVRFKDRAGNISAYARDTIRYAPRR